MSVELSQELEVWTWSVESELGVCSPNLECRVWIWREESQPEQPNLGG